MNSFLRQMAPIEKLFSLLLISFWIKSNLFSSS